MSTWMVVEDEPDLYDTLLALFEIWSIDGVAFTNGTDAIKWIDDVDAGTVDTNLPELALLDIRLPGASGPDIGKRLRSSPVLKDITIVLMTTYHLSLDEEKSVMSTAGADTLIYKPLPSPADFRAMLQRAIAGRKEVPAAGQATPPEAPSKPEVPAAVPPAPPTAQPAPRPAAEPAPAPPPPAAPAEPAAETPPPATPAPPADSPPPSEDAPPTPPPKAQDPPA